MLLIKPEVQEIELKNKKHTDESKPKAKKPTKKAKDQDWDTSPNNGKTFNVFKQKYLLLEIMILSSQKMSSSYRQLDICATM